MKILVLGATKGHSVVALVRSKANADLPGVDMIEGDARDEGTLTCSLVVKGAESPRLMQGPKAVPPMQRVDFSRVLQNDLNHLDRQEEDRF